MTGWKRVEKPKSEYKSHHRKSLTIEEQKKLVDAWITIHEEELKAAWYSYNEDGEIIKIKGLE